MIYFGYSLNSYLRIFKAFKSMKKNPQKSELITECDKFFSDAHSELQQIIFDSRLQQCKLHHTKKMNIIDEANHNNKFKSKLPQQSYDSFLSSLVIDFLRSRNFNYSYTVFMRESNTISEELILRGKLAKQIGLFEEYGRYDGNGISVIQLMLEKMAIWKEKSQQTQTQGIQTLESEDFSFNNGKDENNRRIIMENRINEVRQEVQEREKGYYEKMLKSFKAKQTIQIRENMAKQFEEKLKKFKEHFEKSSKSRFEKQKETKELSALQKNRQKEAEESFNKARNLQSENFALITKIKALQNEYMSHKCSQNQQFQQKTKNLEFERQYLQNKKRQYDLALRNMGTKVEQFYHQKEVINKQSNATDKFTKDQQQSKATRNLMIEQIHGQLLKMQKRVENLSEDNSRLVEQKRVLEGNLQQISEQVSTQQKGKGKHSYGFHEQRDPLSLSIPSNFSIQKMSVMVGVTEEEISAENLGVQMHRQELSDISVTSEEIAEQLNRKFQHKQKVTRLYSEMKMLKNKVRFLVEDFCEESS